MSYEELLRSRAIEPVKVTPREIAELLALSKRDIKASNAILSTDLDWAFAIAYNGILQISIAYMNSLGYRRAARANTSTPSASWPRRFQKRLR